MKNAVLLSLLAVLLVACGTFLKAVPLDPNTGKFPTHTKLKDSEILVNKKVNLSKSKKLAFIQAPDFVKDIVKNIGYFDNVVTKTEFEKILLEKKLTDKVSNVSGLIGLHQAQQAYGDFIIIKFEGKRKDGKVRIELSVLEPESGSTLFHAFRPRQVGIEFYDQNITYPLFNALIDWINENK